MAQKIEQFSRILHHRLTTQNQSFTIPTSNDHTDETWSATDLYIGEIGINVTDDKIFMRTNNGIVQIATGTGSFGSGTASASPWAFTGTDIQIGSTYTANAVLPRSGQYTDLGSTSLPWKDLYLGGSTTGFATIRGNLGLEIRDNISRLISTENASINHIVIQIATQSSSPAKSRTLHLNSTDTIGGTLTKNSVFIGSNNARIRGGDRNVIIGGSNIGLTASVDSVIFLGNGYDINRNYEYTESVGVGGRLVLRGTGGDGTNQYDKSEWVSGQEYMVTSNALTYPIFSLAMQMNTFAGQGEACQIKAYVLGVATNDATKVFSSEILITAGCDGASASIIGDHIVNEVDSFNSTCDVFADVDNGGGSSNVEIYVKGSSSYTIKWLCSYSYHRIINI